MKRKFMVEPNWTDELGYHLVSVHDFDPRQGEGLAHDTLEHRAHTDFSMEEELIAVATSILTRPGDETHHMMGELLRTNWILLLPKVSGCPVRVSDNPEHIHIGIQTMMKHLKNSNLNEAEKINIRRWLQHGLEIGKKRYEGESSLAIQKDFQWLWNKGDQYLKGAEIGDYLIVDPTPGGIKLEWHTKRGEIRHEAQ